MFPLFPNFFIPFRASIIPEGRISGKMPEDDVGRWMLKVTSASPGLFVRRNHPFPSVNIKKKKKKNFRTLSKFFFTEKKNIRRNAIISIVLLFSFLFFRIFKNSSLNEFFTIFFFFRNVFAHEF